MSKQLEKPEEITVAFLEVVVMPNGEIIHEGQSLGFYDQKSKYLFEKN